MKTKKKIKKGIKLILNDEIEIASTFSIFEKWLTEEVHDNELMCAYSVDSIEIYERIKKIERQYLKFVLELNEQFSICLLDWDGHLNQLKFGQDIDEKPTFNLVYREITNYVNQEKLKFIYIKELDAIIFLSYDFTSLLYKFGEFNIEPLRELFL